MLSLMADSSIEGSDDEDTAEDMDDSIARAGVASGSAEVGTSGT